MANLSDIIEAFLLDVLGEEDALQISRNELASYFSVAPSQINYVLSTRFTPDKGYTIESRRGGGGFVTVVRIQQSKGSYLDEVISSPINTGMSFQKACHILERMSAEGYIKEREARLIKSTVSDRALIMPTMLQKEVLRASVMRQVIMEALKFENKIDNEKNVDENESKKNDDFIQKNDETK